MKRFMRRALRRDNPSDPEERPPDAPLKTRHRMRNIRLPNLAGPMSFPSRTPSSANHTSVDPLSDMDDNSSATSLQPTSIRSAAELTRAPIFYDMYDSEPPPTYDQSEPPSQTEHHTLIASHQNPAQHHIHPIDTDSGTAPLRISSSLTDRTTLHDVIPARGPMRDHHRLSKRTSRLMHKRIAAVDAVRTRQRSSTDVPSSASLVTSHASDQQYEPHQYDNLSQPSADRLIDIHEDPSRDQSQFSHTRRVKTSLTESLKAPKERLDKTPHPIQIHPYRKIEESPHAPARLGQQRASASAENRLYHAYTDALQEETRGRSGGLRKIVDILRDNDGNPIVIEKAALAIGILSENDVATRDVFGLHAAVQTLIQCLSIRIPGSYDRSGIVSTVVYAIACLLRDSPRNVRLFEMFDGPHRMGKAAASERYENCPAIPRNALKALSELKHHPTHVTETFTNSSSSSSSSFSSSTSSSTSRTIRYVLRSMTLHEHRTDVQEHGLDALRTLLARAGKGALSTDILNLSAQATATAFQMHSESREVQWQCLTLLCDLDAMREGLFSLDLDVQSFFGALRLVIIEAKLNGKRRPKLGKSSLELIRRAVEVAVANGWRTQDFKDTAVEAGAVETILDVLDVYGDDAQIVDKICTILRVLHQSDEGRFRMNSVTSVCAILAGIETVNANTTAFLPS